MKRHTTEAPPSSAHDLTLELERKATEADEEGKRVLDSAKDRIDVHLAQFLEDEDLDVTTGVHKLAAMVAPATPASPITLPPPARDWADDKAAELAEDEPTRQRLAAALRAAYQSGLEGK